MLKQNLEKALIVRFMLWVTTGVVGVGGIIFLIFFMVILSFFSEPTDDIDPAFIPYYVHEAQSNHIDWAVLYLYDKFMKENENEGESEAKIKKEAKLLGDLKRSLGSDEQVMAYALGDADQAKKLIKDAAEFRQVYDPLILRHRYPIHINERYTQQETFGEVLPGIWDTPHNGVDISANQGIPLFAVTSSTVVKINGNPNSGNGGISITLQDRQDPSIMYYYAHLSKIRLNLTVGSVVDEHKIIGYVGSTGNSTGPHLHFMIFRNNEIWDPTWALKVWQAFDRYYQKNDKNVWVYRDYQQIHPQLYMALIQGYFEGQLYRFITLEDFLDPYKN
jgi:murein DD-endopeptidase MepM/ murein hydrolase activator NlpD